MATNWEIQGVRLDGKASIDAWDVYVNQNLTVLGTTTLDGFLIANANSTFNANITQAHSQTATLNSPVTINNTLDVDPNSGSDEGITILNAGAGQPQLTIGTNSIQEDGSGDMLVNLGNDEVNFESTGSLAKLSMTSTGAGTALIAATDSGVSSYLHSNGTTAGWEVTGTKLQISAFGVSPKHRWYIGSSTLSTSGQALSVLGLTESGGNFATGEVVINEDSVDIDFRVETDSTSDALFVDASADKVEVNVNLDVTGDLVFTGDLDVIGDFDVTGATTLSTTTLSGPLEVNDATFLNSTLNVNGSTTLNGTVTNKDTGTNTPIIKMTDSTNTFEVWKYEYDALNTASTLYWNPNNEPNHFLKFQDNFGNDSLFILAGATQAQIQSYSANWRYRGGANHITYETAGGANIARVNMNAGTNFYEQYSGDTEFNPSGLNTANWKFNSANYTSAGVPLFGLTETSDLIHMSGSIFATALSITNAPLQQLSDTTANLATAVTRDGETAYSTDANEYVVRNNSVNNFVPTPSVLTFALDVTASLYTGPILPNYSIGTPNANGLKAPFAGYIVGMSIEFTNAPGVTTQVMFSPMINGAGTPLQPTTAPNGTDIYETVPPNVLPFNAGDRLGAELVSHAGLPPSPAIGPTWIELHVVYKMPI